MFLTIFFVDQCCSLATGSTLPNFLPRCNKMLENIAVDRDKVLKLIRKLNTNKAHGFDDISASMIKICDCSIVQPLCLISLKNASIRESILQYGKKLI